MRGWDGGPYFSLKRGSNKIMDKGIGLIFITKEHQRTPITCLSAHFSNRAKKESADPESTSAIIYLRENIWKKWKKWASSAPWAATCWIALNTQLCPNKRTHHKHTQLIKLTSLFTRRCSLTKGFFIANRSQTENKFPSSNAMRPTNIAWAH